MSHLRATAESRPTLYRLAAERHYLRIPEHVVLYPADVAWRDRYGSTALHLLCTVRYVDDALLTAVGAILAVSACSYSYLVAQPNVAGWTPLHLACDKRLLSPSSTGAGAGGSNATGSRFWSNRELSLALIHAYPPAVNVKMNTGFKTNVTPFHIACELNAHIDVLRAMLHVNPRLVTESYAKQDIHSHTDNTLQLLWTATQKDSGRPHLALSDEATAPATATATNNFLGDAEAKMALLLEAAYCGTVASVGQDDDDGTTDSNNPSESVSNEGQSPLSSSTTLACHRPPQQQQMHPSFRLLNAACSVRCPREYISRIFQGHSQQASERDETGQLPLHYACMSAQPESQAYTEFLVESLLEYYPQAASISFPLVYILETKQTQSTEKQLQWMQKSKTLQPPLPQSPFPIHSKTEAPILLSSSAPPSPPPPLLRLLPLHVLLTEGCMTWQNGGIQALVSAYPDALRIPDPRNKLPPFLSSAVHAIKSRLHLSTTYELLLAAPEMIRPGRSCVVPD